MARTILAFFGLVLVSAGLITGIQHALAELFAAWLRYRWPTLPQHRARVLRGWAYQLPRLNEEQLLQRVRRSGLTAFYMTNSCALPFLPELLSRWLGLMSRDGVAWRIEAAGLCVSVFWLPVAAWITACSRLANEELRQSPSLVSVSSRV